MTSARVVPQPRTRTRRPSPETARPWGFAPTSMVATRRSLPVSITLTVDAPSLLTYTFRPSGVITSPCGPFGTGMVPTTLFWAMSITATASSWNRPTYALGAATAWPVHNNHPATRAEIHTVITTSLRMLASLEVLKSSAAVIRDVDEGRSRSARTGRALVSSLHRWDRDQVGAEGVRRLSLVTFFCPRWFLCPDE